MGIQDQYCFTSREKRNLVFTLMIYGKVGFCYLLICAGYPTAETRRLLAYTLAVYLLGNY